MRSGPFRTPVAEPLSFARVTAVYRQEKDGRSLAALEEDFYERLEVHLQGLREEHRQTTAAGNLAQARMLEDEIGKTERKREQIITERERKIAMMASQRASGVAVEVRGLARLELDLLDRLEALLRDSRRRAVGHAPLPPQVAGATPAPVPPPSSAPPAAAPALPAEPAERRLGDVIVVRVTQDLQPFAVLGGTYALRKGDVVTLPGSIAQLLLQKGRVSAVSGALPALNPNR